MKTAIILAGGQSLRLKPEIPYSKALLNLGRKSLLAYQIDFLTKHGFDQVVVATTDEILEQFRAISRHAFYADVYYSTETEPLGTSGALLKAVEEVTSEQVYVMNVDDILLNFDPNMLFNALTRGGIIALGKPRIGFGLARLKNKLITNFQEKPTIKFFASCGHYTFKTAVLKKYCVPKGSLEKEVFPLLVKERLLEGFKISIPWITINTAKEYIEVLKIFNPKITNDEIRRLVNY